MSKTENFKKVGYFTKDTDEYIITDMYPKRRLKNFLWNEDAYANVDQFCFGDAIASIGEIRRPFSGTERLIYIKDLKDGSFYSANRNYRKEKFDEYFCYVGVGFQKVVSVYKGIRTEYCYLLATADKVELISIKIKNLSKEKKLLNAYTYNGIYANTTEHIGSGVSKYISDKNVFLLEHNIFESKHDYNTIFMTSNVKCEDFETTPNAFRGVYNGFEDPVGIAKERLDNTESTFEFDYGVALRFDIQLAPEEEKEIILTIGTVRNREEGFALAEKYKGQVAFKQALELQNNVLKSYKDVMTIKTPDEYFDVMANVWLKRQIGFGKTWGRGQGKGFRDVMQDTAAFVSFDHGLAKLRILDALRHQYFNGNAIRMWEPDFLHPYMDMPAWIAATILAYLKETNDFTILDEPVGYLDSEEKESVLTHTIKGCRFLLDSLGKHGLVLWGGGDWNDSVNNVGMRGIGESVWLSIATVKAVKETAELLRKIGYDEAYICCLEKENQILSDNILKHGYKDGYFIYGYNDDGKIIGGMESEEGKMYLNPQTWAVLSGLFTGEKAMEIMDFVERELGCDYGYVVCKPAYTKATLDVGRSSCFYPGSFENASVYNHGVAFKMVADCVNGCGDRAYSTFKKICYNNPKNPDSGVEPYAFSNMYLGPECDIRRGDAPLSWITGTAGWLYRAITEFVFGVKPAYDRLCIKPCLPSCWNSVSAKRAFGGSIYNIEYIRSDRNYIVFDGKEIEGDLLPVADKKEHQVKVYFM